MKSLDSSSSTPNGAHAIGSFAKCEYRYYLGQVVKLSERSKNFNLSLGVAWHRAMEAYYWIHALRETDGRCYPNRPHDPEFAGVNWEQDPAEVATEVMLQTLGTAPEWAEPAEEERYGWARGWIPGALQAYDTYHRSFDIGQSQQVYLDVERTRPAIEVPFSFPLPGNVPPFTGRLDRVYRRGGLRVVQEHKTSHPNYVNLLEKQSRMAIQFGGYNLGYRAIFGDLPAHIELNVIIKSAIPQIHRQPITRTIDEILYLEKMLWAVAGRISDMRSLEEAGHRVHWSRTGILNGYCVDFNRHCLFMPLCKAPNIPLDQWGLDTMYTLGAPLQEREFEEG